MIVASVDSCHIFVIIFCGENGGQCIVDNIQDRVQTDQIAILMVPKRQL